jgi:hypothetical protein
MSEVLGIRLFEYYGKGRREVTSPLLPCKGWAAPLQDAVTECKMCSVEHK